MSRNRCETPQEHFRSDRPAACTTPGCGREASFWTRPDGDCPSCGQPKAIPAVHATSRTGRSHRAWCVPCRNDAVVPGEAAAVPA